MAASTLTESLRETLAVFGGSNLGTPLTTNEVSTHLGLGRRSTYSRLERLADRDLVETKKVGARGRVWWRPAGDADAVPGTGGSDAAEGDRRRDRDLLDRVLETSPIGIGVFDARGDPLRVNQRFTDLLGADGEDPEECSLGGLTPLDEDGEAIPYSERPALVALATGEAVTDRQFQAVGSDGERRWLSVKADPLGEGTEGVVFTVTDSTTRERQSRRRSGRHDEVRAELEPVLNRMDEAFWALDDELRITYINDRAAELLDRPRAVLLGENVFEAFPWLSTTSAGEKFEEALTTGRAVYYEDYLEETERWYDVRLHPAEGGLSVYYRDVTERKARERALAASERHNRVLVDNFPNGAVALFDSNLRHFVVGGELFDAVDVTTEDLEGRVLSEVHPPALADQIEPHFRAVFDGDSSEFEVEYGGSVRSFRTLPVRDEDGEVVAGLAMSQDVTERRRRERELERYETIVETVDDGIYALDEDANFVLVNDAFCEMVGYDREELIGRHATTVHDDEIDRRAGRLASEVAAGERQLAGFELELRTKDGETIPVESRFGPCPIGDGFGRCGVVRDVTERRRRERELERYVGIVDAVGEPVYELDRQGRFTFVNDAMVERSGYPESELLGAHVSIGMDDATVARIEDHMMEFLADGTGGRMTIEYDVITNGGERIPTENRIFVRTDGDGRFSGSAGMLWDVSRRKARERELERQRNRLKALNDLNGVVHGITDAVVEQSTRGQIEETVCRRLAQTDSYRFAWIGDVDGASGTVVPRAEAGVEGYLEDVTITVDPDDERSGGPTGRALRERRIQVTQDIGAEAAHDPWREAVEEYGFRSSAAIPITHDGTLFGVLNVYADRPNAFSEDEQEVIGQLGEVVGHAIAAVERKRALTSDQVVEIEFRIRDVLGEVGVQGPADGSISFEQTIPIGDGTFLVYGTAAGDAADTLEAIVGSSALPHWESVHLLASSPEEARFELRMDEPPLISTVASYGGYVHRASIEDGDYFMRVHLAPSADVRQVVEAVQGAYPQLIQVTRQQSTRSRPSMADPEGTPLEELTDRQRTAVETAYYAGYFGWPRDSNGEDVAASLGIDPSTFHRHLREAQRKILDAVLAADHAS